MKRISTSAVLALFMISGAYGEIQTTTVTFDDGWEGWAGPTGIGGATVIEPEGGNPGANARTQFNDFGITFWTSSNPAFIGDFTQYEEVTVSIDVKVEDISMLGNPVPRHLLVDFRSESLAADDYPWASVWYVLTEMNTGDDWATYSITFDPSATELPAGWGGYGGEDPDTFEPTLPEGVTFADIMAHTEILAFTTLVPGYFYAFTDHDVRIDNISISTRDPVEPLPPPDIEMTLTDIRGGGLDSAPVAGDEHAYVASGVIVLSYDYSNPANPVLAHTTAAQPASGPISSLALHGDYLYASWNRPDGNGGLNVYSLANPGAPELVNVIDDYHPDAFFTMPRALAVVDGYLYMNDTENGLFITDLDEPVALDFQHAIPEFNSFSRLFKSGDRLAASGRNWIGDTLLGVFDVSDPASPQQAGTALSQNNSSFQFDVAGNLAVGAGTHLEIYDFSDPDDIQLRGSVELSEPAPLSIMAGDYAYAGGFEDFQVWNIADPEAPTLESSGLIDSFGMWLVSHTPWGPLVSSRRDRLLLMDTSTPATPAVHSDAYIPGGFAAMDVDIVDGMAYIVQNDYGLSIHDADTLELISQFETDLPPIYQHRAFERVRVKDGHAYLASWGSGLVIADVSDPASPVQTGMLEFPFLAALEVRDDIAYFVTATNDGLLGIADVSNPSDPQVVSSICINPDTCFSQGYDLVIENDHAFIAVSNDGMYIIDVSNPAQPLRRSAYPDCGFGSGVAVDMARDLAFLACSDGDLHIIDISDLDAPAQVAVYQSTEGFGEGHSVKLDKLGDDDLAVFSHREGVDLIHISEPTQPTMIAREEISWPARNIVWHENDVFAFTGPAGFYRLRVQPPPPAPDVIFSDRFEPVVDGPATE